jgi:NAD(P)H dehydrogenase (quinone)
MKGNRMTRYLVTGATGQLGRLVIDHLARLVAPSEIVALIRKESDATDFAAKGIATRLGDYDNPASLEAALLGVERVLLISSPAMGQRVPQHKALIDAAKAAGVGFIAYTSVLGGATNPMLIAGEHGATESLLEQSGVAHTVLRNGWYLENFLMQLPSAQGIGQIFGASGEGRFSAATRYDLAEAAAIVLAGGHDGKVFELGGDEAFTMGEFALALSDALGMPVSYVNLSEESLKAGMVQNGLPEPVAGVLADADAHAANGSLYTQSKALSTLLGRPTVGYTDLVKAVLAQPAGV